MKKWVAIVLFVFAVIGYLHVGYYAFKTWHSCKGVPTENLNLVQAFMVGPKAIFGPDLEPNKPTIMILSIPFWPIFMIATLLVWGAHLIVITRGSILLVLVAIIILVMVFKRRPKCSTT